MPRGPRVDIPGGLYHVIGRGVERRPNLGTGRDREDFLARLATVVEEEEPPALCLRADDESFTVPGIIISSVFNEKCALTFRTTPCKA